MEVQSRPAGRYRTDVMASDWSSSLIFCLRARRRSALYACCNAYIFLCDDVADLLQGRVPIGIYP